jgi:lipoprotein NlpD
MKFPEVTSKIAHALYQLDRRGDKRQRIHHDCRIVVDAAKKRLIPPTDPQPCFLHGVIEILLPAMALGVLSILLMLSACSSRQDKAPYESRVAVPGAKPSPISGGDYVVQPGDSLGLVALRSGISASDISDWNGLEAPYHLRSGQRLQLKRPHSSVNPPQPGIAESAAKKPAVEPAVKSQKITSRQPQPKQQPKQHNSHASDSVKSQHKQQQMAETAKQAEQIKQSVMVKMEESSNSHNFLPDSKLRWKWPVKGKVIKSYRPADPGRRGILISGVDGTMISATESGEVVYSDDGLTGYGQLIIIKHNKHYLSVYAHNRKRLVTEGEWVARGAQIATMGRSSGKAVLHFEIRHNGDPQNPLKYLP